MLEIVKKSLLFKLIFTFTIISFLIGFLLILYFNFINKKEIVRNHQSLLNSHINNIQKTYSNSIYNFDTVTIDNLNQAVLLNRDVISVNVFSEYNFISGLQKKHYNEAYTDFIELTKPFIQQDNGIIYKTISRDLLYNNQYIGRLELFYTDYFINQEIKKTGIRLFSIFILISITFFSFLYFILNRTFIKPVIALANTTRIIDEEHNFSLKLEKTSDDEIGLLYDNFNTMIENIHTHETEVLDVKNYLHNIIESMPSILITIDDHQTVNQWNHAAEIITGIASSDAINKKITDVTPLFSKFLEQAQESISENKARSFYRCHLESNDHFMNVSIYPLTSNGARGIVIRVDDIDELEQKDEQLRQIQKMETIGILAGGLAHDFNNYLGGIMSILSLLKIKQDNDVLDKTRLDEYINTMEESTIRAADIAKQLLMLSRREETSFQIINLKEVVQHVLKICSRTIDKSIQIDIELPDEPVFINGDHTQLTQILLNLFINASHAMTIMRKKNEPQGGRLTFKINKMPADIQFQENHPEGKNSIYWKISVRDTGVGMDNNTVARIFDPFFTTKDISLGTGLGLSVVNTSIKKHYGFIDVYSEKDEGSEFIIYLPMVKSEETVQPANSKFTKEGQGLILVIDDEEIIRKTTKDILEEYGYNVITAENGFEGIGHYLKNKDLVKLVIVDMILPVKNGFEICLELKKIEPEVKILLSSGFKKDERIDEIINLGINGFIQKPHTVENLLKAVYNILYS